MGNGNLGRKSSRFRQKIKGDAQKRGMDQVRAKRIG